MKRLLHLVLAAAMLTAFVNFSYADGEKGCCKSKKECSQAASEDKCCCQSKDCKCDCKTKDGKCKDKCNCKTKDGKCVCKSKDASCKDKCKDGKCKDGKCKDKSKCGCKSKDGGCKDKCKCKTKDECAQTSSAKPGDASKDPTKQEVVIDPVCGMDVDTKDSKVTSTYNDKTYHFCSESCKKSFEKAPAKYIK